MRKILLTIILIASFVGGSFAQESEGIRFFEGTWDEALQLAKKEKKMIFMDCYSTWCGPCANMVRKVFPQKEVGDFYNRNFINVKFNMEKGEGIALCQRYNVVGYPTYLFITEEGFVTLMSAGFMEADKFLELGKKAVTAGPGDEERFVKGERDEVFVRNYVNRLLEYHQAANVESILNTLYKEQGLKILNNKNYWIAFDCCAADINAPLSVAFVEKRKKLYKLYGEEAVNQKIRNLYASIACVITLYDQQGRKDILSEEKKQKYFDLMKSRKLPDYAGLQNEIDFIILLRGGKLDEAYALGEEALKNANARKLCNWAALGERMTRDKEFRLKFANWARRALEMKHSEEVAEEGKSVLYDLETSADPVRSKHGGRKSLPMRGYLF